MLEGSRPRETRGGGVWCTSSKVTGGIIGQEAMSSDLI